MNMYVIVFQGNKNVRHANNLTVCTLQSDFVRYRWFYHRCLRTNNLKNDIIGWLKPTRCQRNVLLLTEMESLMEFFFCIISTEGRLANIMMVCKQKPWKKAEPHLHPKHQDGIFALNSIFFFWIFLHVSSTQLTCGTGCGIEKLRAERVSGLHSICFKTVSTNIYNWGEKTRSTY